MSRIVIAVLLSLAGPGLGQIYNKDYKRGAGLLILSFVLFFLPLFWLVSRIAPKLPDPRQVLITQEMVRTIALEAIGEGKHILNLISFTFLGVWAYAITQAYFKAREIGEKEKAAAPDENSPGGDANS